MHACRQAGIAAGRPRLDRRGVRLGRARATAPRPTSSTPARPYSASKAGSDLIARAYYSTYGLPVMITRSSNNFGPYQYPEKVIPLFVTNLLDGRKVPLYGDGLNRRDWLYVEDNCAAIDAVLRAGTAGEIYNIGAGDELTNRDAHRPAPGPGRGRTGDGRVRRGPASATTGATPSTRRRSAALGWAPHAIARRGPRRHLRLVPRQPVVVGAAEGAAPEPPREDPDHRGRRPARDRPGPPGSADEPITRWSPPTGPGSTWPTGTRCWRP